MYFLSFIESVKNVAEYACNPRLNLNNGWREERITSMYIKVVASKKSIEK